jgi:phosphoribosylformylglycinamidine synthase II
LIDVALRSQEQQRIAQVLGREPTRVELHAFDAQWSEHCSYKSSRAQLRRLPTGGESVVLGPGEDAGILRLGEHAGETYCIVVGHESHNHPSQVVPFEGAATGVGGIVRDVLCMGARVIALADALRFGDPSNPHSHQRHVARAVVDGIGAYGNAIGVPNIAGDVYFDRRFDENCVVNVVALGLVKEREIVHSFAPPEAEGWPILLVGKATDASGFGGASFSSLTLDAENEASNKGAVQVPDPFLKNVLMRATYRVFDVLRERGIRVGCKDLGAGGVMGCSAELCASGGFGARIELDRVNVAEPGLAPEILAVGETQERLLFVLPPAVVDEVQRIYNEEFSLPQIAHNARAVVVGNVTREKRYVLTHRGETVMNVDIEFLTSAPEAEPAGLPSASGVGRVVPSAGKTPHRGVTYALSSLNACSREPLYVHYDSVVRGCTVLPRGYANAGVIAPVPGSKLGVALAVAGDPVVGAADACKAAEEAVREAVRSVVAVGARPIGLTDCLNFGNPTKPEQYADFVAAVEGLAHAARELALPFVSGNVSFYNESGDGRAIPASAIVACIGAIEDIDRVVTPALKVAGSALVFSDDAFAVRSAIEHGRVRSCCAVGRDGVVAAVATMAFAAKREGRALGAEIANDDVGAGFVLEVAAENTTNERVVGGVTSAPYIVASARRFGVDALYDEWAAPLAESFP